MPRPHDTLEVGDQDAGHLSLAALMDDDHPSEDDALEDELLREAGFSDDEDDWSPRQSA